MLADWEPKGIQITFYCGHTVVYKEPFPKFDPNLKDRLICVVDDVVRLSELAEICNICHMNNVIKD